MKVFLKEANTKDGIQEAFVTLLPFREDNQLRLDAFDLESIDAVDGESRFLMNIIPKSNTDSLTHLTDMMGRTQFQIEKNKNYLLTIQKEGYKPYTTAIDGAELIPEITVNIEKIASEKINLKLVEIEDEPEPVKPEFTDEPAPIEGDVVNPFENVEIAVFDQIYYEYNSSKIKPNSTGQLDELAQYMKTYPNFKVELVAHTDARGPQEFNLQLSIDRAQAAKTYLLNKGIAEDRIHASGKGEEDIRNHCTSGVYCTEEEHAYNRRTEVHVIINE
jgi:outer membrane protein OmpA-like peptidoglycan-associated protein